MSLLTSITYSLTPSTFNLVKVVAMASKTVFTMRPLDVEVVRYIDSLKAKVML